MKEIRTLMVCSICLVILYFITGYTAILIAAIVLVIITISSDKLRGLGGNMLSWLVKKMNKFLTAVLLAFIYLFILTPVAGLQKFFFQNPLLVKQGKEDSLFTSRNHIYNPRDFEHPW